MFESLRSLSSRDILTNTDMLVARERKVTLALLEHLQEIERQRLYLELGYGSMFQYCTVHLKYSEPAALRRMRAARCLARAPQLHPLLESGEVNSTTLSMVAKYFRPENADAMIAAIKGKSRRAVERCIAGFEPKAALPPDRVRAIVVPVPSAPAASLRFTAADDGKNPSSVDEVTANEHVSEPEESTAPVPNEVKFERMARVEFTASEEFMALVEQVRSIASHRLPPNATLEQVFALVMKEYVKREDPQKRHDRREAKKNPARTIQRTAKSPRQISAPVRDGVFVRDKGRCTYVSANGHRCDSKHLLQIDHIKPVARGGASTIDNLRLLCAYHNRLEAERLMGTRESLLRR